MKKTFLLILAIIRVKCKTYVLTTLTSPFDFLEPSVFFFLTTGVECLVVIFLLDWSALFFAWTTSGLGSELVFSLPPADVEAIGALSQFLGSGLEFVGSGLKFLSSGLLRVSGLSSDEETIMLSLFTQLLGVKIWDDTLESLSDTLLDELGESHLLNVVISYLSDGAKGEKKLVMALTAGFLEVQVTSTGDFRMVTLDPVVTLEPVIKLPAETWWVGFPFFGPETLKISKFKLILDETRQNLTQKINII